MISLGPQPFAYCVAYFSCFLYSMVLFWQSKESLPDHLSWWSECTCTLTVIIACQNFCATVTLVGL